MTSNVSDAYKALASQVLRRWLATARTLGWLHFEGWRRFDRVAWRGPGRTQEPAGSLFNRNSSARRVRGTPLRSSSARPRRERWWRSPPLGRSPCETRPLRNGDVYPRAPGRSFDRHRLGASLSLRVGGPLAKNATSWVHHSSPTSRRAHEPHDLGRQLPTLPARTCRVGDGPCSP